MKKLTLLSLAVVASCVAGAAQADIINLAAVGSSPGSTTSPMVTENLVAGTYSISAIGTASGGLYDAYTVYSPSPGNGAFADDWYATGYGTTVHQTTGARYNTAAAALSAYQALGPFTFTVTQPGSVSFYLGDYASPYFADDSGGVSLSLTQVPEPASLGVLGIGLLGVTFLRKRRAA